MPNWAQNVVEVEHKDPAKLKALVDAYNDGRFCDHVIPVPEDLKITAGVFGDPEEQKKLELQEQANLEKYGARNWYDFCVDRWGTKWDVGGDGDEVELEEDQTDTTFDFCSAWAPPIGVYEALVEQGFKVKAYYHESGMAFAGIWENGSDDYYEYGGMTSDQVEELLPPELDGMFCISEDISMWEAERREQEKLWWKIKNSVKWHYWTIKQKFNLLFARS